MRLLKSKDDPQVRHVDEAALSIPHTGCAALLQFKIAIIASISELTLLTPTLTLHLEYDYTISEEDKAAGVDFRQKKRLTLI